MERKGPRYGTPEEFGFRPAAEAPEARLPADQPAQAVPEPPPRAPYARWFLGSLGALLVGASTLQAVDFVAAQWDRHWSLGALFTVLLAGVVGSAGAWAFAEMRAYARLREVEALREELAAQGNAADGAARVTALLAEVFGQHPGFAAFKAELHGHLTGEQVQRRFADHVLRPIDEAAYRAVARAARDVGIVTAVAPTAVIDTAIMVWRTARLVREIAGLYGHRAGTAGTWFLLKRLASGAAVVAATDIAGTLVVQQLGGALAEAVAAKLGEGAVAATRTARVGLWTMQLCRLVAFTPDDAPTLRRLAQSVMGRAG